MEKSNSNRYYTASADAPRNNDPMEDMPILSGAENYDVVLHRKILDEMHALYAAKNADYGDAYHKAYQEEGAAVARVMLSFKLNRYKTLTAKGAEQKVKGETITDTLLDLANYAILTAMEIKKENAKNESDA